MAHVTPAQYLTPAEMIAIADRLEGNAGAGKVSRLRPETAYLAQRAIRILANAPTHDDFLRQLCRKFRDGQCDKRTATGCLSCMGVANAAYNLMVERRG